MVRALTTWVWLVDFERAERALDATGETSADVAAALQRHFPLVHILRDSDSALSLVRESSRGLGFEAAAMSPGRPDSGGLDAGSFDCIMMHDAIVGARTDANRVLSGARRLLRTGGWLQVASAHPPLRDANEASGIPRRKLERALYAAGFGEVRTYHVDSALDRLLHFVPGDRRAVLEYESSPAMRSSTSRRRRAVASIGLHSLLYQGYMMLARA
jgi:hypothetical protein